MVKEGFYMPNNQTQKLVQGAMTVAIFSVLLLIALYVPLAWLVAAMFLSLPFAWYGAKYSWKDTLLVAIAALLISFILGNIIAVPVVLPLIILGSVMGYFIQLKKTKVQHLMAAGTVLLLSLAIIYVGFSKLLKIDILATGIKELRATYEQANKMALDMTGQEVIPDKELNIMFENMQMSMPASITIACFAMAFIIVMLNMGVLRRLRVNVPKFTAFKDMRLPKAVLWYYMIVLIINLFVRPEVGTTLYVITLNLFMVLAILLILQAFSFIFFVMDYKNIPKAFSFIAVILAIPLASFIILIGIIDLGFDVRGYITQKKQ